MVNKRKAALIAAAALLAPVLIFVSGFLLRNEASALRQSLRALMIDHLRIEFTTGREVLIDTRGLDSDGVWAVSASSSYTDLVSKLQASGFGAAYKDDADYWRSSIGKSVGIKDLSGYSAFEGELVLGKGTICDTLACNLVALVSPHSKTLYVRIWKT